ncbi:MAG: hypothetical protein FWG68_11340 [Defluviitaleaceae bacterium]|nr:hypothetical protein [Defluviitaleaceae bacterium]
MKKSTKISILASALAAILIVQIAIFAFDRNGAAAAENTTSGNPHFFLDSLQERDEIVLQYAQFGTETILVNPQNPHADDLLIEFIAEHTGETLENAQLQLENWREFATEPPTERDEFALEYLQFGTETFLIAPEMPGNAELLEQFIIENTDINSRLAELFSEQFGQHSAFAPIIWEGRVYSHEYIHGNSKIWDELFASGAEYVDTWSMQSREFDINTGFTVPPNEQALFREYRPSNLGEQTTCQPGAHIGEIIFNPEITKSIRLAGSDVYDLSDWAVLRATRTGVCSASGTIITETVELTFFVGD